MSFRTRAYSRYGASMGRTATLALDTTAKLHLRRVPLDRGGYDPGGAYWGAGAPLWCAEDADGNARYLRATHRDAAVAQFPRASFYRGASKPRAAAPREIWICAECLMVAVNDDATGIEDEARAARVRAGVRALGWIVPTFNGTTGDGVRELSACACDACGTRHAGDRYRFTAH